MERVIIYERNQLLEVLGEVKKAKIFSFDIETAPEPEFLEETYAALDPNKSFISTLSFAFEEDRGFVIPLRHLVGKNIVCDDVWELLKEIFINPDILKIVFNLIFESSHTIKHNTLLRNVADPMLMAVRCKQVLDPKSLNSGYVLKGQGLKQQSEDILGYKMDNFKDTLGEALSFAHLDIEVGAKYSIEDSVVSLRLFSHWKKLAESIKIPELCNGQDIGQRPYKNYWEFLHNVEMPALRVVGMMQYFGLGYNKQSASEKMIGAEISTKEAIKNIKETGLCYGVDLETGKTGKTKSIRQFLFRMMKCPLANVSNKTGEASLDNESINDILHMLEYNLSNQKEVYSSDEYKAIKKKVGTVHKYKAELVNLLKNIKIVQKNGTLVNTHIEGRMKYINPSTSKIHSNYNVYTDSSRFSSSNPNAQNIPSVTKDKLKVRNLYEPARDHILLLIDYSAQEVRISAELYKDQNMIDIIQNNWDIHSFTAKEMFKLDVDLTDGSRVEKKYRNPAKPALFTVTYGGGASALRKNYKAEGIYKSYKDCDSVIDSVKRAYPGIMSFSEKTIKFAEENGYVETMLGYRRLLKDINSKADYLKFSAQRQAINTPVQGTAADVTKMALNRIYDKYITGELDLDDVKIVATIHDEIVFEVRKNSIEKIDNIVTILKKCMEEPIFSDQLVLHVAEPEVADPHDIFNAGKSNGWADKYDYYVWRDAICPQ